MKLLTAVERSRILLPWIFINNQLQQYHLTSPLIDKKKKKLANTVSMKLIINRLWSNIRVRVRAFRARAHARKSSHLDQFSMFMELRPFINPVMFRTIALGSLDSLPLPENYNTLINNAVL